MKKIIYLLVVVLGLVLISPVKAIEIDDTDPGACYFCYTKSGGFYTWSSSGGEPDNGIVCKKANVEKSNCNLTVKTGEWDKEGNIVRPYSDTVGGLDCSAFTDITKPIATMMMIIAPILLLVFGTIDFTGAVAASDEKAMKKAVSNFIKRLIICVVILILPVIVNTLMGWIKFNSLSACW